MEQSVSPDAGLRKWTELASKLRTGQAVTRVIPKEWLPSYLKVASVTGFKVEKIADEKERFPHLVINFDKGERGKRKYERDNDGTLKVAELEVMGKNYIAVSIEGQKGSDIHNDPSLNLFKVK